MGKPKRPAWSPAPPDEWGDVLFVADPDGPRSVGGQRFRPATEAEIVAWNVRALWAAHGLTPPTMQDTIRGLGGQRD